MILVRRLKFEPIKTIEDNEHCIYSTINDGYIQKEIFNYCYKNHIQILSIKQTFMDQYIVKIKGSYSDVSSLRNYLLNTYYKYLKNFEIKSSLI